MAADLSALSPYANDPDVVAYLQALQAQQGQTQPANSALPFDAALTSAYGAADQNYANSIAAIGAQQPALQRTYGFDAGGGVDPNNPFGRAQLLQRSYQQSQRGINNRMAARGQLYAGATQRQQNEAQFNHQANEAALRNEYGQQLAALSAQRSVAENTRNQAKQQAYWDFINAQIQARALNPAGVDPLAPQVGGSVDGTVPGPDGTPIDAGLAQMAAQVGGAPAPAAPPTPYQAPKYNPYAYKNLLGIVDTTPKPYRGPTAPGTGGARAPR